MAAVIFHHRDDNPCREVKFVLCLPAPGIAFDAGVVPIAILDWFKLVTLLSGHIQPGWAIFLGREHLDSHSFLKSKVAHAEARYFSQYVQVKRAYPLGFPIRADDLESHSI